MIKIILDKINNFKGSSICLVNHDKFILYNTAETIKKSININDIYEVSPTGGNIKIDDIRNIQEFLMYKPNFSDYKLVFIHEIDKMTEQASNAILKLLEEPPQYSIIVATTSRWYNLLSTIRSRLYKILIPNNKIIEKIKDNYPDLYLNMSFSIKTDLECADYILYNHDRSLKILEEIKNFSSAEIEKLITYLMVENGTIEERILKYESFFEIIKRFEKLDLIEIQKIIDKIISYKNKINDKLNTLKTFSKLFLSLYHDAYIFGLTSHWKEFYSLKMVYFFGLSDFELDFKKINENVIWCENIYKSKVSNFNFDLTIQTMFFRFILAFFKNKEE
ncbi:hypothetical protein [Marinitoga sp. 38H-ov]|uniref:hypothetical protein n=1 Tax=Marinitoga sp. 38H-ov TaxID=1755814 RepID=UPI0013EAA997|nr:hypothetical protein [Marinitoga sp. 38H-ov]